MTTDPYAPGARVGPAPDQTAPADAGHHNPIGQQATPYGQQGPVNSGQFPYGQLWTDPKQVRAAAKAQKAHAKAMRPWYKKKRWWLLGAIVAIVGISIASGGGDDGESERPTTTAGGADSTAAGGVSDGGQEVYAVGQTAHTGDFDVTLLQVRDPYTSSNQFDTPQPGHRYVAVEVEAVNTSGKELSLSTLLGAELSDSQNRPWDITFGGIDLPDLDGEVPAFETRRGWIVFEVAEDATDLQLRLKGNFTATGSLFDLG